MLSDIPEEKPVLVASNESKTNYEFRVIGDNIFAGLRSATFLCACEIDTKLHPNIGIFYKYLNFQIRKFTRVNLYNHLQITASTVHVY